MSETTPLIKAALNLRVGAGFDVYGLGLIYRCYFAFFSKNILLTHKTEISKSQVNT